MERPRLQREGPPQRDKNKPPRLKSEHAEWIAELSTASGVRFDPADLTAIDDGSATAREDLDEQRRSDGHGDFEEFQRLTASCEALKGKLEFLIGTTAAPILPANATAQETGQIHGLANAILDDLEDTKPDAAHAKIGQLEELLEDVEHASLCRAIAAQVNGVLAPAAALPFELAGIQKLQQQALAKLAQLDDTAGRALLLELQDQVAGTVQMAQERARLAPQVAGLDGILFALNRSRQLLTAEWKALREAKNEAANALAATGNMTVVEKTLAMFDATSQAVKRREAMSQKLDKLLDGGLPKEILAFLKECQAADVTLTPEQRDAWDEAQPTPENNYKIDEGECFSHSRDRHTLEGIFKARALNTAYVGDSVAIFASLEDLRAALAAPPSLRKKWIALGSGKFSAQSKGVEYLCTSMLGDTVVLDTCYPKNRKYPKSDIQSLIEKVKTRQIANVETFYSEVAKLKQV